MKFCALKDISNTNFKIKYLVRHQKSQNFDTKRVYFFQHFKQPLKKEVSFAESFFKIYMIKKGAMRYIFIKIRE